MEEGKKQGTVARLLDFAGERRGLTILGCALSAVAMAVNMVPYVCIWLVIRDLVAVAPNWTEATGIVGYGWVAFGFAVTGIVVYFGALMCTHLAAFRTATNIRKRCMEHLAKTPLGYFDTHASGLLRRRIDGAAAQTETLLAHNLADITGTIAMFVTLLVLLFVFDWRMGAACMLAAVVSIGALFAMVFQDVMLFDDTVMENIRLGRRGATDEEVLAAAAAANCDEFVLRMPEGYATPIGENGARLSGGERQRISIARALLKGAPIVLLDEATASLDVENETKVQGALSRLLADKTVLVIAHRMRTVMGADKVVVLDEGCVVEQGSPTELLAAGGTFARMVELQGASAGW